MKSWLQLNGLWRLVSGQEKKPAAKPEIKDPKGAVVSKAEAEQQGVGGMSTGSGAGLIAVEGVGPMKLRKPLMAVSRPRDQTVATSGADAAQRAIEDAKSILKAVGKGSSKMLASKRETLLLSMPSVEMLRGIEGAGDGEGGINGSVKG